MYDHINVLCYVNGKQIFKFSSLLYKYLPSINKIPSILYSLRKYLSYHSWGILLFKICQQHYLHSWIL